MTSEAQGGLRHGTAETHMPAQTKRPVDEPPTAQRSVDDLRRCYSEPFAHGPVMANVIPGVKLLTNSHLPDGSNVAPAHSAPRKSPDRPFRSPLSTTLLTANGNIWPSSVN